jgi:hypothetical protein
MYSDKKYKGSPSSGTVSGKKQNLKKSKIQSKK